MDTEQWLIEQEENVRRAKEAYQLLYKVYLRQCTTGKGQWTIPGAISEQIDDFFRSEEWQ